MFRRRRCLRPFAVACATAAVAVVPSAASARPAPLDPPASPDTSFVEPAPVVREVQTGGDATLGIVLSGTALIVALGGAGVAVRSQRNLGRPQV
jgi:hypothetical protein